MRQYRITIDNIADTTRQPLMLLLSRHAHKILTTRDRITCTCPSNVLASLILLHDECQLDCDISFHKL